MDFLKKNRITILSIGMVLVCLTRIFVLLLGTDRVNGYSQSVLWAVLQIAVCGLVMLAVGLPAFFPRKDVPVGDTFLLRAMAGVAMLGFAVKVGMALVGLWQEFSMNMLMYEIRMPWVSLLEVLLSILSVGFFFLICRTGIQLPSPASLVLILGPIGLYVIRLIESFMTITMNPSVDTYAILLLSCCAGLMFLSYFGRSLLDLKGKPMFFAWSGVAAVMLGLSSVAALVFTVVKAPAYLGLIGVEDLVCDLCVMLLAIACTNLHQGAPVRVRRRAMVGSAVPVPRHLDRYIPKH